MSTNANWVGGTAPGRAAGTDIQFAGAVRTTPVFDTGAWTIRSITFNSGASSFTAGTTGGFGVTLNTGGITSVANNSTSLQTINAPITLAGGAQTWSANAGDLTFGGTINNGGFGLTLTGGHNFILSGVLSGGGALNINDAGGNVTLSGANTYSGGTTVTAATLNLNNATALGTGTFTVNSLTNLGANLTVAATNSGANSFNNTVTLTGNRTVTNNGTGSLTFGAVAGAARNLTVAGSGNTVIAGAITTTTGTLTYSGTGSLTLAGNNTYSGLTTFSGTGKLNLNSASALGTGAFTISGGGTIDNTSGGLITLNNNAQTWGSNFTFAGTNDLNLGTGTVTMTGNRTVTVNAGNLTVGGVISGGARTLTKAGAGMLTLSGANTITGGVTLSAGTLNINNAAALGTGQFTINGGTIDNTSGGALTNSNNNVQTWGGNFTFTGTNDLNLGTGAVTLSVNPVVTVSAGNLIVGGVVSGAHSLTKAGAGTLTLGGINTYSAGTAINDGSIVATANTALGTGALTINDTAGNTATFNLNGHTQTVSSLTFGGTFDTVTSTNDLTLGTGTLTLGGNVTYDATNNPLGSTISGGTLALGATRTFTINDSSSAVSDLTVSSVISGAGFGLTKTGTGTLVLSGANTFTGATTINGGTLSISADNNLGAAPGSVTANDLNFGGGTLQTTGTFTLNSNRGVTLNAGGGTFDTTSGTTLAYGGIIGGTGALTKTDSGTLILSGANTYTGTTNITGGTLQIAGASNTTWLGTGTGVSGAVNISNGGTLDLGGVTANVVNFGAKQFYISGSGVGGEGAIVNNSGVGQTNASGVIENIALTGDATIGGDTRWDMRGGTPQLDLAGHTLYKTGSNQISIVGGTITDGDITVNQGEFAIQKTTNTGTGTYTFNDGTTLGLWATNGTMTNTTLVFNGTSTVFNESGASTVGSKMTVNSLGTTNFDISTGTSLNLTGPLTVNGAANFNIASSSSLTLTGALGGTGTITLIGTDPTTSILALGANQVFNSTLDLAGGTLDLAGYNLTVNTLEISGNSIIDFGSGLASTLNVTSFIIDSGATLTIKDWADTVDYFYAQNFSGATYNFRGTAPENQITFTGFSANSTVWQSYDHQITPVPEPATYGAIFTAAALGLFLWHRRRARPASVIR